MSRLALAVVLCVVLAACGGDDDTSVASDAPTVPDVAAGVDDGTTAVPPSAVEGSVDTEVLPVLDFVGTDIFGNEVDASVYSGSELVVWFWAPW